MKTEEAKAKIIETLKTKKTVTAQEINYNSKGKIPFVQIYSIFSGLIKNGSVKLNNSEGKKSYTLIDESKLNDVPAKKESTKSKEESEEGKSHNPKPKGGRDLTKYSFNGKKDLNKGRLALEIISKAAKDKRLSLKGALELFPDEIIPPYGLIKPIAEAKKLSKERMRFFIKPEEEIKLRDCTIAVSNQFTPERIQKVIEIGRKQLGYTIK